MHDFQETEGHVLRPVFQEGRVIPVHGGHPCALIYIFFFYFQGDVYKADKDTPRLP